MPNDRDKLSLEYEESLLRLAMISYAEQEGLNWMEEARELRESPDAPRPNPEKIDTFHKLVLKQERKSYRPARKVLYKIALTAAVLALLLSVPLAVSSDFRGAFFDWLFVRQDKYALVTQDTPYALVPAPHSTLASGAKFAPTLLPSGFTETNASGTSLEWLNYYSNKNGDYIEFYQSKSAKLASYKGNSEDAEFYEEFYLESGARAVLYINGGIVTMAWEREGCLLRLKSNLDEQVVKQIALGIQK
ncbi:DUF4367 domain-containing protein [Anaerotruncus rubiinfantis]|uniref:DUF4367 domain-containing protein n=1 Tax=Anaerotruncus rubiinfantis TaxID=1720200 RepID=UPI00082B2CC4|nr:DUF4367 domain-containing protein [Anaerotruncus rubiinfantis]